MAQKRRELAQHAHTHTHVDRTHSLTHFTSTQLHPRGANILFLTTSPPPTTANEQTEHKTLKALLTKQE